MTDLSGRITPELEISPRLLFFGFGVTPATSGTLLGNKTAGGVNVGGGVRVGWGS